MKNHGSKKFKLWASGLKCHFFEDGQFNCEDAGSSFTQNILNHLQVTRIANMVTMKIRTVTLD